MAEHKLPRLEPGPTPRPGSLPVAGLLRGGSAALEGQDATDRPELTPPFYARVKVVLDFLLALLLFILTLPLVLLAMALVKLTSRGPALYRQTRLGRDGRPFTILKIRTMTADAEKHGACWSLPGDSRVTVIGRWLRKSHIDELPQLWNVLRGDMSLVGPRPERPEFVPQLEQAIPHYRYRLLVRPGVTGLAQVQLPPDTDLDSVRTKLAYDLHYVANAGFFLDLRICWATFFRMLGLPFPWLRRMFGFPPTKEIETEYRHRCRRSIPRLIAEHHAVDPVVPALN